MKKLLLSAAAALLCGYASAQTPPLRIVAAAKYIHDGTSMQIADTAQFVYLPGNTHSGTADDYNKRVLKCDTNAQLVYEFGVEQKGARIITKFNAAGQGIFVLQQSGLRGKPGWHNGICLYNDFDAKGNIIHTMRCIWRDDEMKWDTVSHTYTKYSGSNIAEVLRHNMRGDSTRTRHSYTVANLSLTLVEDNSTGSWQPFQQTRYSYDASGNNDTVAWELWNGIDSFMKSRREVKTFVGRNIKTSKSYTWSSSPEMWTHSYYYSYTYDAAGRQIEDSSFLWFADSNRYYGDKVLRHTYNAAGLNDTTYTSIYHLSTDTLHIRSRATMQYNTQAMLQRRYTQTWDGTQWKALEYDSDNKYYYRQEATAVVNTQKPQAVISLHPNPAGNTLHIGIQQAGNKSCVISIYSNMGALVQQWQEVAGNVQRSISTGGFDNGMYILTVRGEDGSKVSKQFVVSH